MSAQISNASHLISALLTWLLVGALAWSQPNTTIQLLQQSNAQEVSYPLAVDAHGTPWLGLRNGSLDLSMAVWPVRLYAPTCQSLVVEAPTSNKVTLTPRQWPAMSDQQVQMLLQGLKRRPKTLSGTVYDQLVLTAQPSQTPQAALEQLTPVEAAREREYEALVRKQHLFRAEKWAQWSWKNNRVKMVVKGLRMAGFQKPLPEFAGFDNHSLWLEPGPYAIFQKPYRNPLQADAFTFYNYTALDTLTLQGRPLQLCYVSPKMPYEHEDTLRGYLWIDLQAHQVAAAQWWVNGVIDIRILHHQNWHADWECWLPRQTQMFVHKGRRERPWQGLGRTIEFDPVDASGLDRIKTATDFTYLAWERHCSDWHNTVQMPFRQGLYVDEKAAQQPDAFWEQVRHQPLDHRDITTYKVLDSLGKLQRVEQKIRSLRQFVDGKLVWGAVDWDARHWLTYNNYEGFRLGMGGTTNDRWSRHWRLEGYAAYGIKDRHVKGSIGTAWRLRPWADTWMGFGYTDDVKEVASTLLITDTRPYSLFDTRPINLSSLYHLQQSKWYLESRCLPGILLKGQWAYQEMYPLFNYQFVRDFGSPTRFQHWVWSVALQWSPWSTWLWAPQQQIELKKGYPRFTLQWAQSLPAGFANGLQYRQFETRTEWEYTHYDGQKYHLLMETGLGMGDIPLPYLYSTTPNSLGRDKWLERFTLAASNRFETMFYNEFFSDRFVYLQGKWQWKKRAWWQGFAPTWVWVHRMAWGTLRQPERHQGLAFNTLEKGYLESGFELNNLWNGLGLTLSYRYGAYHLPHVEDNWALKLSFVLDFGL